MSICDCSTIQMSRWGCHYWFMNVCELSNGKTYCVKALWVVKNEKSTILIQTYIIPYRFTFNIGKYNDCYKKNNCWKYNYWIKKYYQNNYFTSKDCLILSAFVIYPAQWRVHIFFLLSEPMGTNVSWMDSSPTCNVNLGPEDSNKDC